MITHAVIGDFPQRSAAVRALADLGSAGFRADRISIVSEDPELARELGGRSYVRLGVIAGVIAGVVFTLAVIALGGSAMPVNSVGVVIGAIGVIGGLAFIGLVLGRAIVRGGPDASAFAAAVEHGDVLVEVQCSGDTCERARQVLTAAGATDIREEASPGPT